MFRPRPSRNTVFAVRLLGFLLSVGVAVSALAPSDGSSAATSSSAGDFDFTACVANQGAGAVVILVDESDTVYSTTGGREPSDPEGIRVAGAQILVDDLARVASRTGASISVQLAGFGDNFVDRTGKGWQTIAGGAGAGVAESLKVQLEEFNKRPVNGNQIETDVWSALNGARNAFKAQATDCQLLVVFKDGYDFQKFDANNSSTFPIPDIQELLEKKTVTAAREAAALATEEICRPLGSADGLRGDGIFTIAVGFGSGNFNELEQLATNLNQDCGDLPGQGAFLQAEDGDELISAFSRALSPSFKPTEFNNAFRFGLNNALSSVSILTSGLVEGDVYTIRPPASCATSSGQQFNLATSNSQGTFGEGVDWTASTYAEGRVLRVFIERASQSDLNCWNGTWSVEPGSNVVSSVEIDADLEPSLISSSSGSADGGSLQVKPGESLEITPVLRRSSSPGEVGKLGLVGLTAEDLSSEIQIRYDFKLVSSFSTSTNLEGIFPSQSLRMSDLGRSISIDIPETLEYGTYKILMYLKIEIPSLQVDFRDVATEQNLEIQGPLPFPEISESVDFGDVLGSSATEASVVISNPADKPLTLHLNQIQVSVSEAPANAAPYQIDSESDEIELPAGSSLSLTLRFSPDSAQEVRYAGGISGEFLIPATTDSETLPENYGVKAKFSARQLPDKNLGLQLALTVAFLLIGILVTAAAVWFVSYRVSRFPSRREINQSALMSTSVPVVLHPTHLEVETAKILPFERWDMLQPYSRKKVGVPIRQGSIDLVAKSPGLRIGAVGYGSLADKSFSGWGSTQGSMELDERHLRPHIGLGLNGSHILLIDGIDLPQSGNEPGPIKAELVLIADLRASDSVDQMLSEAQGNAMTFVELLQNRKKFAAPDSGKLRKTKKRRGEESSESTDTETNNQSFDW